MDLTIHILADRMISKNVELMVSNTAGRPKKNKTRFLCGQYFEAVVGDM